MIGGGYGYSLIPFEMPVAWSMLSVGACLDINYDAKLMYSISCKFYLWQPDFGVSSLSCNYTINSL